MNEIYLEDWNVKGKVILYSLENSTKKILGTFPSQQNINGVYFSNKKTFSCIYSTGNEIFFHLNDFRHKWKNDSTIKYSNLLGFEWVRIFEGKRVVFSKVINSFYIFKQLLLDPSSDYIDTMASYYFMWASDCLNNPDCRAKVSRTWGGVPP